MMVLFMIPVMFITFSQPFTLSLIMTIQTIFTSFFVYLLTKHVWMSLTLILVMVGGLMISFVYVSSLMPAEPYTRAFTWVAPMVIMPFVVLLLNNINYEVLVLILDFVPINIFNSGTFWGTLFMMGMLIMTLLMVCINTLSVKSPMRSYS